MKILLGLALAILVLQTPQSANAQKTTFNVGLSAFSAAFMPAFVADQAGYFAQEGIATRLVFMQSGVQLMQSVIAGDTQIGMGSAPELVTAVNAGAKVHAFWGISNLMPYALISRPNIKSIAELKGKKIAVSARGSLSEFLASYVLKNKGLDPAKDVFYVPLGGVPTRFAALLSGSADASLISAAQFDRGRKAGLNFLFMLADLIPEWPQDVIYLKDDFVASRDAEFRAFMRAYRRGVATSKKDAEFTIAAMQKAMRFDQATARDGYKAYVASLPDDGRVGEKGFELLVAQMFDEGTIKRRLTMTDLIDYRYIYEAQKK